jgi:hypothetical protein
MKTMICLILDRSGSMGGREDDVVGGVNAFLQEQQALDAPASIAMVRFDTGNIERFRPMQNLKEARTLTRSDFQPRGGTPLLDAVGSTIVALDGDWKTEQPEHCIVVIVTDGQENASREFSKEKVKSLIQARQESGKWAFIYLGANVDSFAEAGSMGIAAGNTANYHNTAKGTRSLYGAVSASVGNMRYTGETVAHNLGGTIEESGELTKSVAPPVPVDAGNSRAWTPPQASGPWTPPAP